MKKRREPPKTSHSPGDPRNVSHETLRLFAAAWAAALVAGFFLYSPSIGAPFLFDDAGLRFAVAPLKDSPLSAWLSGVRPALMLSYWLNHTLFGDSPVSYHAVNVAIHSCNAALVFLSLRRLLALGGWAPRRITPAAAAGALVFLIHPLQTESVSYIAGRSESLAALFMLLAYVAFLYRRTEAISWGRSVLVLALFAIGAMAKENAVSLIGILALTDIFWPTPFSAGLKRNWRLYALAVPGAVVAAGAVFAMLAKAPTAGFSVRGVAWYQYGFTQARAIFAYIRLALFPVGLSIDHDFPVSHNVFEHGAIYWLLLLACALSACFYLRRRYPLACFGFLFYLVALAPTSSIVPVADALVERRTYLPLMGLILIGCEVARRVRIPRPAAWTAGAAAVTLLCGWCYARNRQYAHPDELFLTAAAQSTHNARPYSHLAHALYTEGRCQEEIPYLERADRLFPNDYEIQMEWGGALECLGRLDEAAQRLRLAAQINPRSDAWEMLGLIYGAMNKADEAGAALRTAVQVKPQSASAHRSLGLWYEAMADYGAAEREYSRCLEIDRRDKEASLGLLRVSQLRAQQPQ